MIIATLTAISLTPLLFGAALIIIAGTVGLLLKL
jgi:hypothetical protein